MLQSVMTLEEMGIIDKEKARELEELGIDQQKVIQSANSSINSWNSYFQDNVTLGKRDTKFLTKDQWEANERGEFNRLFKVCSTYNITADIVNKIIGEQRKMRPALMVRSINGIATEEALDLRTDLLRSISYHSDNDIVYQTAFDSAMKFGYGALQIYVDYENKNSFRKVIKYDLVEDVTTTFFDPRAKMPHKGDGDFCGRLFQLGLEESQAKYPWIAHFTSFSNPQVMNTRLFKMKDTVVFCDLFQKEWFPKVIYEVTDGQKSWVVDKEQLEKINKEFDDIIKDDKDSPSGKIIQREKPRIIAERLTEDYRIMHYRLLKDRIVESTIFPSDFLPIIFMPGRSCYLEGKQYVKSFIRDVKDVQKFVNYLVSEIATEVKNRRREQWVVTPANITGYEDQWRNPEISYAALKANPDPKTGFMPRKESPSEVPQSLINTLITMVGSIKEILGVNDASLGNPSNEKTGIAIENRVTQGNLAALEFYDNMSQAIAQGGRVCLSLMPNVYGDERSIVLSNAAGESRTITLNKKNKDGSIENPITQGDYDIEVSAAPSFAMQKAQTLELFIKLASLNPQQILPLIADLLAKNMDVDEKNRIVKRFEKLVPPDILAEEKGEPPPPPPPPSPEQQMMEVQKQVAMQQVQERASEIKIKEEKLEMEKAKLALEAMELQEKFKDGNHRREAELAKADMDFTGKIAHLVKDLHK